MAVSDQTKLYKGPSYILVSFLCTFNVNGSKKEDVMICGNLLLNGSWYMVNKLNLWEC